MENKDQYTEIKDISWLSEKECCQRIREYDENKRGIINKLFEFLRTYENHVMIKK